MVRAAAGESRNIRRLTYDARTIANVDGVPVATWSAGGTAPDGEPATKLTFGPGPDYSWGAYHGYLWAGQEVPAGHTVRMSYWARASAIVQANVRLSLSDSTEQTLFDPITLTPEWTFIQTRWMLRTFQTTAINRAMTNIIRTELKPGMWSEVTGPLIEFVQ